MREKLVHTAVDRFGFKERLAPGEGYDVAGDKRRGRSSSPIIRSGMTKKSVAKKRPAKKGTAKRVLPKGFEGFRLEHGIVNQADLEILNRLKGGPSIECPAGQKPVFRCELLLDGSFVCRWVCE
jgi:hypothetical protein